MSLQVKERSVELGNAIASEDGAAGAVKAFFKYCRLPSSEPRQEPPGLTGRVFSSVMKCFACS